MKVILYLICGLILVNCNTRQNKLNEIKKEIFGNNPQVDVTIYPDTTVILLDDGLKKLQIKHDARLLENRIYYPDDSLYLVEYFVYDQKDSVTTIWYENGNKMSEEYFQYGSQHGISKMWFDDGALRNEFRYKNGKMIYGRNVILDDNNFIDYVEIQRNGNVTKKDFTLRGKSTKEFKSEIN